jgi:hypothetical protein
MCNACVYYAIGGVMPVYYAIGCVMPVCIMDDMRKASLAPLPTSTTEMVERPYNDVFAKI